MNKNSHKIIAFISERDIDHVVIDNEVKFTSPLNSQIELVAQMHPLANLQ